MARFDDLCADFQKRKPRGPITAEVPWFNVPLELQKGSESVNDVLRKYLKDFNLEYLNEMGTVWFLYGDFADTHPHTHGNETDTLPTVSGDS